MVALQRKINYCRFSSNQIAAAGVYSMQARNACWLVFAYKIGDREKKTATRLLKLSNFSVFRKQSSSGLSSMRR
jgi:hypothetical protein